MCGSRLDENVPARRNRRALRAVLPHCLGCWFRLWADAVPLIGMLMIPKTCAYVWTVLIGFNSLRNADRNESEAAG